MTATSTAPPITKMVHRDLTRDTDISTDELNSLLELAGDVKGNPARYAAALERPLSELAFREALAAHAADIRAGHQATRRRLRCRASAPSATASRCKDIARNLDRWTNGIVARIFKQETIEDLAHLVAAFRSSTR